MSETNGTAPTTTEAPSITTDNPLVSKPLVSPKPYDDDMMEAYEAESEAEAPETLEVKTELKPEAPKEEEKSQTTDPKSTKADKVDDGFEKVVIEREINGKPLKFTVEEAIKAKVNQEETMRSLDRRATFIKQKEVAWQNEQDNFKTKVANVLDATKAGDFTSSIRALAKIAKGKSDLDITSFEKQYFDQLDKIREVYTKMTPEQKEAYFAKRALEDAKTENKKYLEKEQLQKAREELETHVFKLQKENNISEQEFWENYKYLVDNQIGEDRRFNSKEEITAEEVIGYSNEVKNWTRVYEAAEIAKVEDDAILEEVNKIALLNPHYTAEDLVKIMDHAGFTAKTADPEAVENLNRKAGKSRLTQERNLAKKQNGEVHGYDQDSLEFLYRKQPKVYQRAR